MNSENQNENQPQARLVAFQQKVRNLKEKNRSFSATVREVFPTVESAIKEGTPLEALLSALNEHYGLTGTISAFKSALNRIRKEMAALQVLGIRLNPDGSLVMPAPTQTSNGEMSNDPASGLPQQQNWGQFQQVRQMSTRRF